MSIVAIGLPQLTIEPSLSCFLLCPLLLRMVEAFFEGKLNFCGSALQCASINWGKFMQLPNLKESPWQTSERGRIVEIRAAGYTLLRNEFQSHLTPVRLALRRLPFFTQYVIPNPMMWWLRKKGLTKISKISWIWFSVWSRVMRHVCS